MTSRRLGMGLVGPGFVGAHHIDAVRRLGFVDVVAVAASSDASAAKKADALGVPRSYGSFEALAADPDVHVIHNTTPNHLHTPVIMAALARGKHVISDKPLAMTGSEARALLVAAEQAGVVHAVTFNYRGNPLVQQARSMVAAGEMGPLHFVHGSYLQDWLLEPTDFSWRLEPDKGGASSAIGDIGSHWCDLVQYVTGLRIVEVLADLTTVIKTRYRPAASAEAFAAQAGTEGRTPVTIYSDDLATVLVRFDNGARGAMYSPGRFADTARISFIENSCSSRPPVRSAPRNVSFLNDRSGRPATHPMKDAAKLWYTGTSVSERTWANSSWMNSSAHRSLAAWNRAHAGSAQSTVLGTSSPSSSARSRSRQSSQTQIAAQKAMSRKKASKGYVVASSVNTSFS